MEIKSNGKKPIENLVGMVFGKLTVVEYAGRDEKWNKTLWKCVCSCSEKTEVIKLGKYLKNGDTQSCGCYKKEKITTHNKTNTKEYSSWQDLKYRCENKNNDAYKYYGGRGIIVCDEWKNSFEQFYKDMGDCPEGYTIERIDNNGNYCKDNCKWATRTEQMRNRRKNHFIKYNGENKSIAEWAEIFGINYNTFCYKVKSGWTMDQICGYEPRNGKYYYAPNLMDVV